MLNELSPWHIIIVLLVFAVLFGSKRLPDAARGLGQSMRIFKAEMRAAGQPADSAAAAQPAATAQPMTQPAATTQPTMAAPPAVNPAPVAQPFEQAPQAHHPAA